MSVSLLILYFLTEIRQISNKNHITVHEIHIGLHPWLDWLIDLFLQLTMWHQYIELIENIVNWLGQVKVPSQGPWSSGPRQGGGLIGSRLSLSVCIG